MNRVPIRAIPDPDPALLSALGLIHNVVKEVDCIRHLAGRLTDHHGHGDRSHRDMMMIRDLSIEVSEQLRSFLDVRTTNSDDSSQPASVGDIVRSAVQSISRLHRQVALEIDINETAAKIALPKVVSELLVSLLDNAITHGASAEPTRISAILTNATLTLAVEDCGPGMSSAALLTCRRLGYTTGPRRRNSGIGLAAAAGITRQMGGNLRIECGAERGTIVMLEIPVDHAEA